MISFFTRRRFGRAGLALRHAAAPLIAAMTALMTPLLLFGAVNSGGLVLAGSISRTYAEAPGNAKTRCFVTASASTFERTSYPSDPHISFEGIEFDSGSQSYLFSGLAEVNPKASGAITFLAAPATVGARPLPAPGLQRLGITGYQQSQAGNRLNVSFKIHFPGRCVLPIKAVYVLG